MTFEERNRVVTRRYEAVEGNIKYDIISTTSDDVLQQVKCEINETTEATESRDTADPAVNTAVNVRLGNIELSNGYKNMHIKEGVDAVQHVAAFEAFIASIQ